jgi:putative phosphoesterase
MLIGVVSDTHNNLKNIDQIISLFNDKGIQTVIHTGDIANAKSLEKFSKLNANLIGVYGNNDRSEAGLEDVVIKNNFQFQEPPKLLTLSAERLLYFMNLILLTIF